jgi:hypothetical protein
MNNAPENVAGYQRGRKVGIQVYFDPDQFEEIRAAAIAGRRTFSEQVRLLCEWGMEVESA